MCFLVSSAFVFVCTVQGQKKRTYKALIIIPLLIIYVETESILHSKYLHEDTYLSNSSQIGSTNEGWCVIINIKNDQNENFDCLVAEIKYN